MSEPIIFDIGSHTAFFGVGGNDAPSHALQLSSYFTNSNDAKRLDSGTVKNGGPGDSADVNRGSISHSLPLPFPFPFYDPRPSAHIFNSRGIIEDWGMIERLWSVTDLAGERILLSESVLNTNVARAKTLEILIEGQACASVCLSPCSLLSLFASGRTDGSVLELGHRSSFASALYEGSVIGVAHTPFGGADISAAISGDVWEGVQRNQSSHTDSDQTDGKGAHNLLLSSIPAFFSAVDDVKRQMASLFERREVNSFSDTCEYALSCPDGTQLTIEVSPEAHQRAAGVLFSPGILNPSALLSSAPNISRENCGYSEEAVPTLLEQFMANKYRTGGAINCSSRGTPPPAVSSLIRSLLLQISGADASEEGSPMTSRAIQLASTSSPLFTRDVLLTGGTSLFQGLDTALTTAIKKDWSDYRKNDRKHATHDLPPTTNSTCTKGSGEALSFFDREFESGGFGFSIYAERRQLTWIGGSILSTLPAFDQISCSRTEYDEHGAEGIATMKAANAFKHVDRV